MLEASFRNSCSPCSSLFWHRLFTATSICNQSVCHQTLNKGGQTRLAAIAVPSGRYHWYILHAWQLRIRLRRSLPVRRSGPVGWYDARLQASATWVTQSPCSSLSFSTTAIRCWTERASTADVTNRDGDRVTNLLPSHRNVTLWHVKQEGARVTTAVVVHRSVNIHWKDYLTRLRK